MFNVGFRPILNDSIYAIVYVCQILSFWRKADVEIQLT